MKKKFISVATFCAVIASMPAWVGCSDYDDDIQNLQGQITANATDLSGLVEEKANALTQEINNLKSQDATLTTALETAKAELNAAIEEAKSYADVQAEAAQVAAIEAAKAEVATAQSVLSAFIAPSAISITVSRLTAPYFSSVSAETCSMFSFTSLEYATIPPLKYSELPGTDVTSAAMLPPVQLSAVERVIFLARNTEPNSSSTFISIS